MDVDTNLLFQFLAWIISGGGATAATYFLMEKVPALVALSGEYKRYASLAIAAVVAMLAFLLVVVLSYHAAPESAQAWVENLFAVAFVAVTSSQAVHGRTKLRT